MAALLRQLRNADPKPDHVIVVDNGSSGGAADLLAREFPDIDIIRLGSNRGFAAAANIGIERALERGAAWVWLLNSDIALPPDALARLRDAASGDSRCGMAGAMLVDTAGCIAARGGGHVSLRTAIARHARSEQDRCDYLSGACVMMRAAMLRDIGLFDERYFFYWEDIDLGFRARSAGWTLAVATDCRVVHDEASTLGAWSRARWYHLFRGMFRFVRSRAPMPRTAALARLAGHSAAMLRYGRREAFAGAWDAAAAELRSRRWTEYSKS